MVELNVETETADALWQAARKRERVILSVTLDGQLHHFHTAISDVRVTKHGSTGWRDGKPCTVELTLRQLEDAPLVRADLGE
jgi:hypothetical protein